jgi:hypothetical protein
MGPWVPSRGLQAIAAEGRQERFTGTPEWEAEEIMLACIAMLLPRPLPEGWTKKEWADWLKLRLRDHRDSAWSRATTRMAWTLTWIVIWGDRKVIVSALREVHTPPAWSRKSHVSGKIRSRVIPARPRARKPPSRRAGIPKASPPCPVTYFDCHVWWAAQYSNPRRPPPEPSGSGNGNSPEHGGGHGHGK